MISVDGLNVYVAEDEANPPPIVTPGNWNAGQKARAGQMCRGWGGLRGICANGKALCALARRTGWSNEGTNVYAGVRLQA